MHSADTTDATTARTSDHLLRSLFFWGAAITVVALDQITKGLVRTYLDRGEVWPGDWPVRIRYVTNTGAAFGILQNQTLFLMATTVVGVAAIYLYYRYPPFDHLLVPAAIGMMLGGATGNLIDRVRLGRVTDFIDFPMWPAFNVADSSITIGIIVILLGYLFLVPRARVAPHEDG